MEYQCTHIKTLIDQHLLDLREEKLILHQLYRNIDGYMSTKERDMVLEISHCPICGLMIDKELAIKQRHEELDAEIIKKRNYYENTVNTYCPFCKQDVRPTAIPLARKRHKFIYTCPLCGGRLRKGMTLRLDSKVHGTIDKRNI